MADARDSANLSNPVMFAARTSEPESSSKLPWVVAAGVLVLLAAVLYVVLGRKPHASAGGPVPYASSLVFSGLQLSESSALSGVKVTYVDGQVRNVGRETVTGATAEVQFSNDEQLPPQRQTVPVTLIRTHEPYVDTEPLSAEPLRPGQQREFRLIFEDVASNWNQQLPVIRLTDVSTR